MTRQVRIFSTILGFSVATGLLVRPPDAVRAQAPQSAPGQRQPGTYPLGPDSLPQDGVPKGQLEGPFLFKSQILAGTVRRYWIYVPAQYTGATPANVLVFQDGQRATNPTGVAARAAGAREPDSQEGHPGHDRHLHHARPARRRVSGGSRHGQSEQPRRRVRRRSSDAYARFIVDEMLPEVGKTYNLTTDPGRARDRRHEQRRDLRVHRRVASAGPVPQRHQHDRQLHVDRLSSGARRPADGAGRRSVSDAHPQEPDQADQDLSAGRFGRPRQRARQLVPRQPADARGARVREPAADAKKVPGPRYEVKHEWGDGAHSDAHGGSLLPDILRWMW